MSWHYYCQVVIWLLQRLLYQLHPLNPRSNLLHCECQLISGLLISKQSLRWGNGPVLSVVGWEFRDQNLWSCDDQKRYSFENQRYFSMFPKAAATTYFVITALPLSHKWLISKPPLCLTSHFSHDDHLASYPCPTQLSVAHFSVLQATESGLLAYIVQSNPESQKGGQSIPKAASIELVVWQT